MADGMVQAVLEEDDAMWETDQESVWRLGD